jgi:site-specific recombinase XerD
LLYLDELTLQYLSEWKQIQNQFGNIEFVFSYDGLPIGTTFLGHIIDTHSKYANIKRIRVHDLRHSHASFMLSLGMNDLEMQNRLGHGDIRTTLGTYSHLRFNAMKDVVEKFKGQIEVTENSKVGSKFRGNQYIRKAPPAES